MQQSLRLSVHTCLLLFAAFSFTACSSSGTWSREHRSAFNRSVGLGPIPVFSTEQPVLSPVLATSSNRVLVQDGEGESDPGEEDKTGTDPRGFATKFMPFYRYTELENGLEEHQMTAFGLLKFSEDVAMTYEVPVAMSRDFTGVDAFEGGGSTPNGLPLSGDETGLGDSNIRMFQKLGRLGGMDWMAGFQLTFPTATQDGLGSGKTQAGPMLVNVIDIPKMHAFFAMMHITQFDVFGDDNRDDIGLYIGRYFYMQPLSKPGPGAFDGIYLLPEFQPIYDFENSEFSFWVGPELGKVLGGGQVVYIKPGWGIDAEDGERDRTLELGFRWFF